MFNRRKKTRVPGKVIKARSNKYKFSIKTHPIQGIISLVLGIISFVMLLISCYLSWQNRGNLGITIGLFGIMAFIIAISGLVMAFATLKRKDIHLIFPVLSLVVNGILTIVYLGIYMMGTLLL